jgi:hypothetical protein
MKRQCFSGIQMSHVVAAEGYAALPLRTGYDNVIAHRVDDLFAYAVKESGTITAVTPEYIAFTPTNPDSKEIRVQIGRRYGVATGTVIPHDIVTDLSVGTKVEKGHVIAWNSGFFERDIIVPSQVVWLSGIPAKTVLWESPTTFEDSCEISPKIARQMRMQTTEVRELTLRFTDEIRNLVQIGETVDADSFLCSIQDPISGTVTDLFDQSSIDKLRLLSRNSPRAKYAGEIGAIEVTYNGDLEDASETVRDLIVEADRRRARLAKQLKDGRAPTGEVMDVELDTVVVKIYINSHLDAADGDKGVFGNQLKTVIKSVFKEGLRTESGIEIDAVFSYTSVNNRIVLSPTLMGMANTLLRIASKRMANTYFDSL